MKNKTDSTRLTVHAPLKKALLQRITRLASIENRSRTNMIAVLLEEAVINREAGRATSPKESLTA